MVRPFIIGLLTSCLYTAHSQQLNLSTPSDSALFYYYEGWRQVMDEGNYSQSEIAYRKMMDFDPDFLVGLSLLGRITKDVTERQQIEKQLAKRKGELNGDERILLNTFIEFVKLTNQRELNPEGAKLLMESTFKSGEQNLVQLVHRYPDEIYYKAEYIEVLHHNHGPQTALDSLYKLASVKQQNIPFLLGYAASLEAEAGNFEDALKKVDLLFEIIGEQSPKPFVVQGDIYYKMGNFDVAIDCLNKAIKLDPENLDAQRLMTKINNELNKK